ncbi:MULTISPECIES: hypothetical protein [Candidatus Neomicrothrix]|uniref:hypothetical protein n=1 Tax=Candidatus Neomicrothrix TaxID=41949 RepID=UPI0004CF7448|nr:MULTISPECIES: hypothetical protein [Microthrix]NLH67295.1 hypothetical protein [Candidatus Microthrix parvicella]MBK7018738.1 hypothetical protein [Candidatus Microthrix sp.]MBK7321462.1 hypothetical protein [Candidatus Microthrix sp.]MBL0205676.1 hypothetical protein [Candidatus Microthrix sp.]MBP6148483.1 hypothetical protein [Candidatus Microthrix sp.]
MCQRVTCPTCQRPTYAGCGSHIEQVLGDVAPADRCQGHARGAGNSTAKRSWFGRRGAKV